MTKQAAALLKLLSRTGSALNQAARYGAKVPTGESFFNGLGNSAGRLARLGFNPYIGKHGLWIKPTVSASLFGPAAYGGWQAFQNERDRVRGQLNSYQAASAMLGPLGVVSDAATAPVTSWMDNFANHPMQWLKGFAHPEHPAHVGLNEEASRQITNNFYTGVRNMMHFDPAKPADYAVMATRPALIPTLSALDSFMPDRVKQPDNKLQVMLKALMTPSANSGAAPPTPALAATPAPSSPPELPSKPVGPEFNLLDAARMHPYLTGGAGAALLGGMGSVLGRPKKKEEENDRK